MLGMLDNYLMWPAIMTILGVTAGIMMWKMAPYLRFAYPTAKVQAIGNPFIVEKELNQLMESKSIESFKNSLNSLKDFNVEGKTAAEIQQSLDEHFVRSMKMIQNDGPKKLREFYHTYLRLIDSMAVKTALKLKVLNKEIENIPTIFSETETLVKIIQSAPQEDLPAVLKEKGFGNDVVKAVEEKNLLELDIAIDRKYLKEMRGIRVPRETKAVINEFLSRLIDVKNMKNLFRAKHLDYDKEECKKLFILEGREIPEWKFDEMASAANINDAVSSLEGTFYYSFIKNEFDKDIQSIENALDKALLKVSEDLAIKNFPLFGPLLRFIISKEYEIRNLKVIVKGIEEKVGVERMKPLLVLEEWYEDSCNM